MHISKFTTHHLGEIVLNMRETDLFDSFFVM